MFIDEHSKLPRPPTKDEYFIWESHQAARVDWMNKNGYDPKDPSLLFCDNPDHCYEVIQTQTHIWNIYLWASTTMNVNEFLAPLIVVNAQGYRKIRPNQGLGQRSLISSRVRLLFSNAKKFPYVRYQRMPREVVRDRVFRASMRARRSAKGSIPRTFSSRSRLVCNLEKNSAPCTRSASQRSSMVNFASNLKGKMCREECKNIPFQIRASANPDAARRGTPYFPNFDFSAMDD